MSDIICTSSNAVAVVNSVPADKKIIFAPDKNLGRYIIKKTGRDMVLWNGSPRPTTFMNGRQLKATIAASDVAALGTALVSVSNAGSPGSNIEFFHVTNSTASVSFSRTDFPTGAGPLRLLAGDFNGDGKLDLAIPNSGDNTVSILLGNGDGTFTTKSTTATGPLPYAVAAGDFNW